MKAALLIIITAVIFELLLLIKSFFKNDFINTAVTVLGSLFILLLIAYPDVCMKNAINGAALFFYKVFPTTFPFLVVVNIIIHYDGVFIYSKLLGRFLCKPMRLSNNCSIALIVSMLCGYPLGAKYSCDLYENSEVDYKTFLRLINIASNCSPLFIVGTIGASMLKSPICGYILLAASYISCFIMGLILPGNSADKPSEPKLKKTLKSQNLGEVLKNSVEDAVESCILVFGFIVIYSVILGLIKNTTAFTVVNRNKFIGTLLLGMVEITNGCNTACTTDLDTVIKLALLSFFTSFSGLCVISQAFAYISKYSVPIFKYVYRKFLQGIISSVITVILFKLNTYSIYTISGQHAANNFSIIPVIFMLLIVPFVLYKIYHISSS